MALCRCYYCSPTSTKQHTVAKQDALQKFAYVPSDYDDVVVQRGQADEPVFCFTTALKGLFWSIASYRVTVRWQFNDVHKHVGTGCGSPL